MDHGAAEQGIYGEVDAARHALQAQHSIVLKDGLFEAADGLCRIGADHHVASPLATSGKGLPKGQGGAVEHDAGQMVVDLQIARQMGIDVRAGMRYEEGSS